MRGLFGPAEVRGIVRTIDIIPGLAREELSVMIFRRPGGTNILFPMLVGDDP